MHVLSIDDVTQDLRVARGTVIKLIKTGQLPAFMVGKQYRIRAEDLAAFMRPKPSSGNGEAA